MSSFQPNSLVGLVAIGAFGQLWAASPRLELAGPAGGPFTLGDTVKLPVYLRVDAPALRFVAFGIQSDPGTEIFFAPSPELIAMPDVEFFNDRPSDSRHVSAGLGNFDFNDWTLVLPVAGGRVELGTVIVRVNVNGHFAGELSVEVGTCPCTDPETPDRPVVDLGTEGKLEPEGSRIRFPIADQDFVRGDATHDGRLDIADPIRAIDDALYFTSAACTDADDANDDGLLDLSDAVYLFGYLFLGGDPPPAPFPAIGRDPTADGLYCHSGA
jgi:hypothetical protein